MKDKLSWRSILTEGVVIVASILLAFAIDAWWAEFDRTEESKNSLRVLLQDSRDGRAAVNEMIQVAESMQSTVAEFYSLSPEQLSDLPQDRSSAYLRSLIIPMTYDVSHSAVAGFLGSNRRADIQDQGIQSALQAISAQIGELEERGRNLTALEIQGLSILSRHPGYRARILRDAPITDLRAVQTDEDLMALAASQAAQRSVNIREMKEMVRLYERLETEINRYLSEP